MDARPTQEHRGSHGPPMISRDSAAPREGEFVAKCETETLPGAASPHTFV